MLSKRPPIGYFIRQADQLLTKGIDGIQSSFGFTRTGWQVLNTVYEEERVERVRLAALLAPFVDLKTLEEIIDKFQAEGLITAADELAITEKGVAKHGECLEKQNGFRRKVMLGISEEQYETTVLTLVQIIENISNG